MPLSNDTGPSTVAEPNATHPMTGTSDYRQIAIDATVSLVATAFAFVAIADGTGGGNLDAIAILLIVVSGIALLWRRRWPVWVLTTVVVSYLLMLVVAPNDIALTPAVMVALYTVARQGRRGSALAIAATTAIVTATAGAVVDPTESFASEILGELASMLFPVAVGDAMRTREERLRDRIETEARSRVQAERVRIARDLHDVVAHGLSIISVQSGVAAELADSNPEHAKKALEVINTTTKTTLEELRDMVGVLRSTDDAPLRPTPSDPNDLTDLIDAAAAAGLNVHATVTGTFPDQVSDASVVATHRILQEALTNVVRHAGSASVDVNLSHGVDQVTMEICNHPGTKTNRSETTGVGIIGMTERAHSIGGTVTASPTDDGGFTVRATLPYRRRR